jgi:hypothetical protein
MTKQSGKTMAMFGGALALLVFTVCTPGYAGPPNSTPPNAPGKTNDCFKQCVAKACSGKPVSCRAAIATLGQCDQQCQLTGNTARKTPVNASSQGECVNTCKAAYPDKKTFRDAFCPNACTPVVPRGATVIWMGP